MHKYIDIHAQVCLHYINKYMGYNMYIHKYMGSGGYVYHHVSMDLYASVDRYTWTGVP